MRRAPDVADRRPPGELRHPACLNIHLHCLVLDGVYRCGADGAPSFVEVGAPTVDELHALLVEAALARHKQSTGLSVSGLGLPNCLRPPRWAEAVDPQGRDAARDHAAPAPVRRHRRVQPARGSTGGSTRPQAAGTAVPRHHPAGAFRRAGTAQCRRAGGIEAQDAVAQRHHASGDEPAGVHPTAGGAETAVPAAPANDCIAAADFGSRMPAQGRVLPASVANSAPDRSHSFDAVGT